MEKYSLNGNILKPVTGLFLSLSLNIAMAANYQMPEKLTCTRPGGPDISIQISKVESNNWRSMRSYMVLEKDKIDTDAENKMIMKKTDQYWETTVYREGVNKKNIRELMGSSIPNINQNITANLQQLDNVHVTFIRLDKLKPDPEKPYHLVEMSGTGFITGQPQNTKNLRLWRIILNDKLGRMDSGYWQSYDWSMFFSTYDRNKWSISSGDVIYNDFNCESEFIDIPSEVKNG